jgi:tetratricopeptide (TPR) repeat protein
VALKSLVLRLTPLYAATALIALAACSLTESSSAPKPLEIYVENEPVLSGSHAGSYLAGRFAQKTQDWNAAQDFMSQALDHDADNNALRQKTFLLALGAGNHENALKLARDISKTDKTGEIAQIYIACDAIAREDYKTAAAIISALPDSGFGEYAKPLLGAWALVGEGKKIEALALLQKNAGEDDATYHMHAGMIEDLTDDTDAAAAHYKIVMEKGLTLHSAFAVASFYSRIGAPEISATIFDGLGKLYPFSPFTQKSKALPKIAGARGGAAYALYDLASMLHEKHAYDSAQVYGNIAALLDPSSDFTRILLGDISAIRKQYPAALDKYGAIAANSPLYWLSRMRMAEVYEVSDNLKDAEDLLTSLAAQKPTRINALISLGDIYRRAENYPAAFKAYDEAVTAVGTLTPEHWPIIYARGMMQERLNNWNGAEKDLLQALEFQPDNPEDGYILDSYGWALYRTGSYAESVAWMEKAVSKVPDDATILDHLGDVYWQAGRQTEARYQWLRARDHATDPHLKAQVTRKADHGMTEAPAIVQSRKEAKL